MRGEFEWEHELTKAYRHMIKRDPSIGKLSLRISQEIAMEIQESNRVPNNIEITTRNLTWQGIPMRIDRTLSPGCFIFEEGVKYD